MNIIIGVWSLNQKESLKVTFDLEKLMVKQPSVVKVISKDIKPILTQEGFSNVIAMFAVNKEDVGRYIHKNFSTSEYFEVETDSKKSGQGKKLSTNKKSTIFEVSS